MLVIFGGMTNYSGDDISKFLWMIRIAGKQNFRFNLTFLAGVFTDVKEDNFYTNG